MILCVWLCVLMDACVNLSQTCVTYEQVRVYLGIEDLVKSEA